ncbi:membrane protein insertion efficiency factor [uncultured Sphaerochaeta sp.]|uniref:membrane protein insertion efficiency factor YidD n=1 Tax=uncultured Sphaerochaeta sp. TaxID=886478 RepID=UPI002A0A2FEB|nr:membrane protein insertion efficiency factor [uncultured Sphaerochaeta sp.]
MNKPILILHKLLKNIFLIPVYFTKGCSLHISGKAAYTHPVCSTYMVDAVLKHGILKGSIMGLARIFRCSRMFMGGSDPVQILGPGKRSNMAISFSNAIDQRESSFTNGIRTDSAFSLYPPSGIIRSAYTFVGSIKLK